jgi:hypothetical protein
MTGAEVLALVALAGTAAGTGLQMDAASNVRDQENKATSAELLRQKGYQKQATGEFEKSLAQSGPEVAQGQIDTGAANRLAEMNKVAAVPLNTGSPLDLGTPNPVQSAQSAALLSQQAQAKAKLGGYSDYDLAQWIKNLRAQQQLGMYSQFARQSQQVLPYELQDAARSGATESSVGGLVSQLGMLAGLAGASGIGKAAPVASPYAYGAKIPQAYGVGGGVDYSMFQGPYA